MGGWWGFFTQNDHGLNLAAVVTREERAPCQTKAVVVKWRSVNGKKRRKRRQRDGGRSGGGGK